MDLTNYLGVSTTSKNIAGENQTVVRGMKESGYDETTPKYTSLCRLWGLFMVVLLVERIMDLNFLPQAYQNQTQSSRDIC